MMNTLSHPMDDIRQKYVKNLVLQRGDIQRLSAVSSHEGVDPALQTFAHKLAGTGKIYGFPEISEAGYSLECALRQDTAQPEDITRKAKYLLSVIDRAIKFNSPPPPVRSRNGAPLAAERSGMPRLSKTRPELLVIDDDENIANLIHMLFGQIANVTVCPDVAGGLQAAYETPPQLILLDDQMPGERSGMDLLQQLRDIPVTSNIPIIMMSANDSLTNIMQALVIGATDYMIKPFEPMDLISKGLELLKTHQTRILIVDDDEMIRDLLEQKLSNAGCIVDCASECQEAWDKLEQQQYSLVLLDRMMPDLEGSTLLRMMHGDENTSRIPVVFLTARRSAADVVDGLLTGAADYITKPFDPDDVVKRCINLLKARKH